MRLSKDAEMALPTNIFTSYDSIGNMEDVQDIIWNVDPDETPFFSMMAKGSTGATFHEWQTDVLDTPSEDNAHLSGDDIEAEAVTPTVRLGNYAQIFRKSVTVSGTEEVINKYGRGRETAYQQIIKAKSLRNDMEKSIFANKARVAGGTGTARVLAGLGSWLVSNVDFGAGGANPTGDGSDARTDGTQRAFTEAILKNVLASIFDNSGKAPDCAFAGSFNKQALSGFPGGTSSNLTQYNKTEGNRVFTSVDVYEYDFGSIVVKPARHVRPREVPVVSTDMWEWSQLRPLFIKRLGETGDNTKFALLAEATLVCRNEKASGLAADLTTA